MQPFRGSSEMQFLGSGHEVSQGMRAQIELSFRTVWRHLMIVAQILLENRRGSTSSW